MIITKLPCGWILRPQHAQEDFEEETMEDDEAELTLNKVEEEMMVSTVIMIRTLILLNWVLYVSLFFHWENYFCDFLSQIINDSSYEGFSIFKRIYTTCDIWKFF